MLTISYILKSLLRIFGIVYVPFAIVASIISIVWGFLGWIFVGYNSFDQCEDMISAIWVEFYEWLVKTIKKLPTNAD